jgi:hypothetical protein
VLACASAPLYVGCTPMLDGTLLSGCGWWGEVPQLRQRGKIVPCHPQLRELAVANSENTAEVDLHLLMRGREGTHLILLRPLVRCPKRHQVTFGYKMLERLVGIRKHRSVLLQKLDELLPTPDIDIRGGLAVANEVSSDELPNNIEVPGVRSISEATHEYLVLLLG